jgi:UDP-4-amino-4-deoxy-L-arabinose-oxoglutarate aminotransferase
MKVPFYRHELDRSAAEPIAAVLETPFLTTGAVARGVEGDLKAYFDVPEACVCNSWTNGALATLLALDIGAGDEVILPAMTFVACANVVELTGARPVFVDVDPRTLLIDVEQCRAAITPRTRAVMPVHLYGQMCDMARLVATVKAVRDDITVIEDCAHSFESRYDGHRPGTYGDVAIFSFYATKNVTCGEGGAIITRDGELMARIRQAVLHGMSAGAVDRFAGAYYRHWDVENLGTKANLPDLLAALLPPQIRTIDERRAVRQRLVDRYRAGLTPALRFAEVEPAALSAHHLFPIHVDPDIRDRVLYELNSAGVGTTVNYRSVHRLGYYRRKYALDDATLPVSARWGDGVISLPLYVSLDADAQEYVIDQVNRIVASLTSK